MLTALFRIWNWVAKSTSHDDNCYATSTCVDTELNVLKIYITILKRKPDLKVNVFLFK